MTVPSKATFVFASSLALTTFSGACLAEWGGVTKDELRLLPYWCRATQSYAKTDAEKAQYARLWKQYGEPWTWMHHYCRGLALAAREDRSFPRKHNSFNAREAIGEMYNALVHTDSSFPPRAEMLASIARTQAKYTRPDHAAATATTLIEEFPNYADGYVILAELLLRAGKREEAVRVLDRGAEIVADKERFERLKSILPRN